MKQKYMNRKNPSQHIHLEIQNDDSSSDSLSSEAEIKTIIKQKKLNIVQKNRIRPY